MQPPYLSKQTLSTKDGASLVSPASGNRHGCLAIPLSLPPSPGGRESPWFWKETSLVPLGHFHCVSVVGSWATRTLPSLTSLSCGTSTLPQRE